ncbi:FAD-binding domain-containing protein [Xylariaceae sp. FL1272]|nr:FAD-binding domain-containing protein [Xylariaceae sp. FL1272]
MIKQEWWGNAVSFEDEVIINWSQTAWLSPACFVRPTDSHEVAAIMKVIETQQAKFAIRAGGHNPNANFASVNELGVLIDLRELDSILFDPSDDNVLRVGPGNTWDKVYTFAETRGRGVIGGRHGSVGVSGLLLGGGLSFFSGLFGMAVDSVVNFEVVLSNSTIVNANSLEYPDLYRALKGGGANFGWISRTQLPLGIATDATLFPGVVTRFDIETYTPVHAQYTINMYSISDYVNVMYATARLQMAMEDDPNISFFLNVRGGVMVAGLLYAGNTPSRPRAFDEFFELESLIMPLVPTTSGPILDLVPILNHVDCSSRRALNAVSTNVDPKLYTDVHERYMALLGNSTPLADLSYTIQAIPSNVAEIGRGRGGGNSLGLSNTPQSWWACLIEWFEEPEENLSQQMVLALGDSIRAASSGSTGLLDYIFMNDAEASQRVIESYGAEDVNKLRSVAARYDPGGVFQKLQNAGFLL